MKRLLSLTLALLMLCGMLAACSTGSGKTSTTATTAAATTAAATTTVATTAAATTTTATTTAAATTTANATTAPATLSKPTEISWLCTNTSTLVYDWSTMTWLHSICENANVKLDIEIIDKDSWDNILTTRLAAGVDLADVMQVKFDSTMTYINAGLFYNIADIYENNSVYYKERLALDIYDGIEERLHTPDGGMYQICQLNAPSVRPIIINKPWVEALGMEIPKTTTEYYDYLAAVKTTDLNGNNLNDEVPLFLRPGFIECASGMWGIDLTSGYNVGDDGKLEYSASTDNYAEFLAYFNKLYTEGLLYNEYTTSNLDIQNNLFSNNNIGSIIHYCGNYVGYNQKIDPNYDQNNPTDIMLPIDPLEGPYGPGKYLGLDLLSNCFSITRDCENPEAVFNFIDYCYSDEALTLLYNGIEGIDYNIVNGKKEFTDVFTKNEDNYRSLQGWNFGGFPTMYGLISSVATQAGKIASERQDAMLPNLTIPARSDSFVLESETETIQNYATDLNTYVQEMCTSFITGIVPLDQYDSYLETLKALHYEDILAVYQAQYDRNH